MNKIYSRHVYIVLLFCITLSASLLLYATDYTIPPYPDDIKCGDIDADGHLDLIINHRNYGLPMVPCKISLLNNNGNGTFNYTDSLNLGASYLVAVYSGLAF